VSVPGKTPWSLCLLGATSVQVCTAAMNHGFRIVEDMCEGLNNWMDEKGFEKTTDFIGKSVEKITHWEDLDINYHHIANIDQEQMHPLRIVLSSLVKIRRTNQSTSSEAIHTTITRSKKKSVWAVICANWFVRSRLHHDGRTPRSSRIRQLERLASERNAFE
jgi:hypothetical protein